MSRSLSGRCLSLPAFLLVVFASLFLFDSCSKSTELGGDILSGDLLNVTTVDTFTIQGASIANDTTVTYNGTLQGINRYLVNSYLIGSVEDPLFGKSTASLMLQPILNNLAPAFGDTCTLDSIVLVLRYDTLRLYSDYNKAFHLKVTQLESKPDYTGKYRADSTFKTNGVLLGEVKGTIKPFSRVKVGSINGDTLQAPHLRIRLDSTIGKSWLKLDPANFKDDASWLNYFKGLVIEPVGTTGGFISVEPVNDGLSGILVYFTRKNQLTNALTQTFYRFPVSSGLGASIGSVVVPNYRHERAGSLSELALSNQLRDSLLLQGNRGPIVKLSFPHLKKLGKVLVNFAELECTVLELDNDNLNNFLPPGQLLMQRLNTAKNGYSLIRDLQDFSSSGFSFFGGALTSTKIGNKTIYKYKMRITGEIQGLINGTQSEDLYISLFPKMESANRVVLAGPKHPQYPMKLRLVYTLVD